LYLASSYSSFASYPGSDEKAQFHRDAKKLFKASAPELEKQGLKIAQIRSNKGGPAVSGEVSMYVIPKDTEAIESTVDGLFCDISASNIWNNPRKDHIIIMARYQKIRISKDDARQEGFGGLNCFASPKPNIDPASLADWLFSIYHFKLLMPKMAHNYIPHIEALGGQKPYQKTLF
jgi:hypothetical protein